MKRRITSLALILCILLTTLIPGPLAFAEEPAQPSVEQGAAAEYVEEPSSETISEELPPPDPDSSVEEDAPPTEEESLIEEEPPVEEEPSTEEDPAVEEDPVEGVPAIEEPAEEGEPDAETPAEEESIETETFDLYSIPALGSSGVEYAGVHYISQAAYNSLPEDSQVFYTALADFFESKMEQGEAVTNAVFSVDSEGKVVLTMTIPSLQLAEIAEDTVEENLDEQPDAVVEEQPDAAIDETPLPYEEISGDPSNLTDESADIISENVELAESLWPEDSYVSIHNPEPLYLTEEYNFPEAQALNSLYWKNKNLFYNQLSSEQKKIFNRGKENMVDGDRPSFDYVSNSKVSSNSNTTKKRMNALEKNVAIAISALIDTYPFEFDYVNWGSKTSVVEALYQTTSNKIGIFFGFDRWEAWSQSLENEAQSKVASLVKSAFDFARQNYPNDITYGLVYYFDDWICKNNSYNEAGASGNPETDTYYFCHSSYGVLLKGYGVCESYALAMGRMLDAAGIPNLYATGKGFDGREWGGHAWNYVQMPNGKFYLQDCTWNDTAPSSMRYDWLLGKDDGDHRANGSRWGTYNRYNEFIPFKTFKYATLNKSAYKPDHKDAQVMSKTNVYLTKGKSETLAAYGDYYQFFDIKWSNSDSSVATLKNGKITAKKLGKTVVTQTYNGTSRSCNVYVYQAPSLAFADTKKAKYSARVGINTPETIVLNANMGKSGCTAENLVSAGIYDRVSISYKKDKRDIASVSATLKGNQIQLSVRPLKIGSCTVTIKFANKSATLTLDVAQPLEDSWFALDFSNVSTLVYNGKAKKPEVKLTGSAPDDLKIKKDYTVKYLNNTNAGTATVRIVGKGYYGRTIDKTFTIERASISKAKITTGKTREKNFNGKVQKQSITVKLNGKTLKKGKDYSVKYAYTVNGSNILLADELRDAHMYVIMIGGIGNYRDELDPTNYSDPDALLYTINPVPLEKVDATYLRSVAYNGKPVSSSRLKITVKIGKSKLTEGVDYKVQYVYPGTDYTVDTPPTARGTYTVCIRPFANGNIILPYPNSVKSGEFTIR